MTEIIKLENVQKKYSMQSSSVIQNINLSIKQGEMVAIMGPSGSGKSTLMNILGCLDKPSSGQYWINGERYSNISPRKMAKFRNSLFGYIFQQYALLEKYTVYENIELPILYRNQLISRKKRTEKIRGILESLEMIQYINKYPYQLSGGQQQRVAIARALVNDPDVILADEPTGALDQKIGKEIMKLLNDLNNIGKTVIIITHDPNIASYCGRKIEMLDGNIIEHS